MPAGCCDDAEARRKTEINSQPFHRYEIHFTGIQRTSSITYFAVRKTTLHKLPQLKLGPTIYGIGPPVKGIKVNCLSYHSTAIKANINSQRFAILGDRSLYLACSVKQIFKSIYNTKIYKNFVKKFTIQDTYYITYKLPYDTMNAIPRGARYHVYPVAFGRKRRRRKKR